MAQTVIEMGVKLKIAITSGFSTILPTTMDDLLPTKKAKEGHDLQLSVVTSSDDANFGPLGANTVVAEPMRAVPKALNMSKYKMMSSFSNPFWTPIKYPVPLDPMEDPLDPQYVMDPKCTDNDVVYLMRCKRNIEGEIKQFKYRKASAKGFVKKWQGQEELLKTAIQATATANLRYKETLEDLSAKMTFKRGLAADCQANIDIENNKLDHVNKRLRELRR